MDIGELATATGGTTGGLYLLYRIERMVAAALAKRNGKSASCGPNIAETLERSAIIQERTAEVLDRLHDSMTSVREEQAVLLRAIDREVMPTLKSIEGKLE